MNGCRQIERDWFILEMIRNTHDEDPSTRMAFHAGHGGKSDERVITGFYILFCTQSGSHWVNHLIRSKEDKTDNFSENFIIFSSRMKHDKPS